MRQARLAGTLGAVAAMCLSTQIVGGSPAQDTSPAFQSYSKFDFVPGDQIVAMEDFTQDAIGDFPDKWDTNSAGEVVTIAGQSGRWLKVAKGGFFMPEFITDLPDNVTVEFDLVAPSAFAGGFPLQVALVQLANRKDAVDWESAANHVAVTAFPGTARASSATSRQDSADGSTIPSRHRSLPSAARPCTLRSGGSGSG